MQNRQGGGIQGQILDDDQNGPKPSDIPKCSAEAQHRPIRRPDSVTGLYLLVCNTFSYAVTLGRRFMQGNAEMSVDHLLYHTVTLAIHCRIGTGP